MHNLVDVMNLFRKFPIEFWILFVVPSLITISIVFGSNVDLYHYFDLHEYGFVNSLLLFIPRHLFYTFLILFIYATGRCLYWLGVNLAHYIITAPTNIVAWRKEKGRDILAFCKDLFFTIITVSASTTCLVTTLLFMGTFDPERILRTGIMIMDWDKAIFGQYLPFSMQGNSWSLLADQIFIPAYLELSTIITLTIIGLMVLKKKQALRRFLLSFFLASTISVPIWSTFPSVTPNELFRENIFAVELNSPMAIYAAQQSRKIGPNTMETLSKVDGMQSRPNDDHYHVPTFPSMHVAWGIILVYFGFSIAWPVGIVFAVWWILNICGAILSLQHFGVDVIAGTLIGTLAFLLAKYLLHLESKYLSVPKTTYDLLNRIGEDCEQGLRVLRGFLTKKSTSHKS